MRNHKKINGKLLRTDKKFCHLKQKQKEKIGEWLYAEYRRIWSESGREPGKKDNSRIVDAVMEKIEDAEIWIPVYEVRDYFYRRKKHYRNRISKELSRSTED